MHTKPLDHALGTYPGGRQEIHEVKGYLNDKDPATRLCRCNLEMIEANNPCLTVQAVS